MAEKRIHLIFKTHLDIGFSDLAENVRKQYHKRFIPQALDTGEYFYAEDPAHPRFIWTTGAWLIWDYLQTANPVELRRLERAIGHGIIRWHALPFTTHSELMSPALFRAGLSFGQELDRRFGRITTAAKMTDVPGHTLGIVPILANAGIRFLHLGVNPASPVPTVPPVFRWRAPGGEEIVVMYEDTYGGTQFPEGFDHGLSFAHTGDNLGPQSVPTTSDSYRRIAAANPGAEVYASTLDAYGNLLWSERDRFPVVTTEIGDSWIHGAASDPAKTARFLALQRLYDEFAAEPLTPGRQAFGRGLTFVAEHTWGLDIKSYLRDEEAWDRRAFENARSTDYRFAFVERSWAEQRDYLIQAVAHLGPGDRTQAKALLEGPPIPAAAAFSAPTGSVSVGGWNIVLDQSRGDVNSLTTPSGQVIAARDGSLWGYRYESYDATDMAKHLDSYLTIRPDWAILDHDKPGLANAATACSAQWIPKMMGAREEADAATVSLEMPVSAAEQLGAPKKVEFAFRSLGDQTLEISVLLRAKPANRMPEASFVLFTPESVTGWDYLKMGLWQPGSHVVGQGGGHLQAVSSVRTELANGVRIEVATLDAPLVGPADSDFMIYNKTPPALKAGLRFNLHNNKWGTNFPMWWSGDFLARFKVRIG